jgi:hypothetical protein
MTAEIAIMNKEAIALAADSAVTMSQEGGQKIFASANKLFTLSKYYPVGIMVYGNASFMGIPWESIIKIYRNKAGKQKFDTLIDYADDFINFLDNGNPIFLESEQEKYLSRNIFIYFSFIKKKIDKKVEAIMEGKNKITNNQIKKVTTYVIKEQFDKLENLKDLPSIPKNYSKKIVNKYKNIINKIREEVFEKLPLSPSILNKLRKMSAILFTKEFFLSNISGIVIAGFGEGDTFPSLRTFDVEGVANDKLKYRFKKTLSGKIDFENSAAIIPFAQKEMVVTFMEGIEPSLQKEIDDNISKILYKYPEIIAESINKYDDNEKLEIKRKLKEASKEIFKNYQKHIAEYRTSNYVHPVIKVVSMLPKDELAAMAESFVNLTSFKRKVSMVTETVGGPIDVAVISKGDGFIWIKRKHYFKAELNPNFFSNYYRR